MFLYGIALGEGWKVSTLKGKFPPIIETDNVSYGL
jgi:hypothetical protein